MKIKIQDVQQLWKIFQSIYDQLVDTYQFNEQKKMLKNYVKGSPAARSAFNELSKRIETLQSLAFLMEQINPDDLQWDLVDFEPPQPKPIRLLSLKYNLKMNQKLQAKMKSSGILWRQRKEAWNKIGLNSKL